MAAVMERRMDGMACLHAPQGRTDMKQQGRRESREEEEQRQQLRAAEAGRIVGVAGAWACGRAEGDEPRLSGKRGAGREAVLCAIGPFIRRSAGELTQMLAVARRAGGLWGANSQPCLCCETQAPMAQVRRRKGVRRMAGLVKRIRDPSPQVRGCGKR